MELNEGKINPGDIPELNNNLWVSPKDNLYPSMNNLVFLKAIIKPTQYFGKNISVTQDSGWTLVNNRKRRNRVRIK